MADYSGLYAETEERLRQLLIALHGSLSAHEQSEVSDFLDAHEYGLALGTLSGILIEESKPILPDVLHEIDSIAESMDLRDERFMNNLHNVYDRQRAMY